MPFKRLVSPEGRGGACNVTAGSSALCFFVNIKAAISRFSNHWSVLHCLRFWIFIFS